MVVCLQMEALCDSVILEEPPKHAGVICVAVHFTDVGDGPGVGVDDVVLPDGAVSHGHVLARILSQGQLEEGDGEKQPACGHFVTLDFSSRFTLNLSSIVLLH